MDTPINTTLPPEQSGSDCGPCLQPSGSRFVPTEEHLGLLDRFEWFDHDMTGCGMQLPDEDDQALAQELCAAGLLENCGAGELQWMDEHGEITASEGVIVPAYRIIEAGRNALLPASANTLLCNPVDREKT